MRCSIKPFFKFQESFCLPASVCLCFCLCLSRGQSRPYSFLPQCPRSSLNPGTCLQLPIFQLAGGSSLPSAPLSLTTPPATQCPFTQGLHSTLCLFQIPRERKKLPGCFRPGVSLTRRGCGHMEPCLPGSGGFCKKEVQPEKVLSPGLQPSLSSAWHLLVLPLDPGLEAPSPHTFPQQPLLLLALPCLLALANSALLWSSPHLVV